MIGFRFKRHERPGPAGRHLQAIEKHLEGRVRKLLAIPTRHLKQRRRGKNEYLFGERSENGRSFLLPIFSEEHER